MDPITLKRLQDELAATEAAIAELDARKPKPQANEEGGFWSAMASGGRNVEGSFYDAAASGLRALGFEDTAQGLERSALAAYEQSRQNLPEGSSSLFEMLGEQLPMSAPPLIGGAIGGLLGSVGGPPGTAAGVLAGGTAFSLPLHVGGNKQEQRQANEGIVQDEGAAALAAIPQAALDSILNLLYPGGLVSTVGKNLFTKVVIRGAEGAAMEVPTEVGQQVLQRLQAGEDLTSPEALESYRQVAVAAGLIGGTFGAATAPFKSQEEKQAEAVALRKRMEKEARALLVQDTEAAIGQQQEAERAEKARTVLPEPLVALPDYSSQRGAGGIFDLVRAQERAAQRGDAPPATPTTPQPKPQPAATTAPLIERPLLEAAPEPQKPGLPKKYVEDIPGVIFSKEDFGAGGEAINANLRARGMPEKEFFTADDLRYLERDEFTDVMNRVGSKIRLFGDFDLFTEPKPPNVDPVSAKKPARKKSGKLEEFKVQTYESLKAIEEAARVEREADAMAKMERESKAPISSSGPKAPGKFTYPEARGAQRKGEAAEKPRGEITSSYAVEQLPRQAGTMWRIKKARTPASATGSYQPQGGYLSRTETPKEVEARVQKYLKDMPPGTQVDPAVRTPRQMDLMFETEAAARAKAGKGDKVEAVPHSGTDTVSNWAVVERKTDSGGTLVGKSPVATYGSEEEARANLDRIWKAPEGAKWTGWHTEPAKPTKYPGSSVNTGLNGEAKISPEAAKSIAAQLAHKAKIKAKYKDKLKPVLQALLDQANRLGLPQLGAKVRLVRYIVESASSVKLGPDGKVTSVTTNAEGVLINRLIKLALDGLGDIDALTSDQIARRLGSVLNHEAIHLLRRVGLFTDEEWGVLKNYVSTAKDHRTGGKKTFLQIAQENYGGKGKQFNPPDMARNSHWVSKAMSQLADEGIEVNNKTIAARMVEMAEDAIHEEAIAEAFRAWSDKKGMPSKASTIFGRILEFFKGLAQALRGLRKEASESIFQDIHDGIIATRTPTINKIDGAKFAVSGKNVTLKLSNTVPNTYEVRGKTVDGYVAYFTIEDHLGNRKGSMEMGVVPDEVESGNIGYVHVMGLKEGPNALSRGEVRGLADGLAEEYNLLKFEGERVAGAKVGRQDRGTDVDMTPEEKLAAVLAIYRPRQEAQAKIKAGWSYHQALKDMSKEPETKEVITHEDVINDMNEGIRASYLSDLNRRRSKDGLPPVGEDELVLAAKVQEAYAYVIRDDIPHSADLSRLETDVSMNRQAREILLNHGAELFDQFRTGNVPIEITQWVLEQYPEAEAFLDYNLLDMEDLGDYDIDPDGKYSVVPNEPPAVWDNPWSAESLGKRVHEMKYSTTVAIDAEQDYIRLLRHIQKVTGNVAKFFGYKDEVKGNNFVERQYHNYVDKYITLGKMVETWRHHSGTITADNNPYMAAGFVRNKIVERQDKFLRERVEPFIKALADKGLKVIDIETYLYARHAKERNAYVAKMNPSDPDYQEMGSGMTNEEAQTYIDELASEGLLDKVKDMAVVYDEITAEIRQLRQEYGLDPPDIQYPFQFYAPLKDGMTEDGEPPISGIARVRDALKIRGREDRAVKGRLTKANNLLANTFLMAAEAISRGERNLVGNKVDALFREMARSGLAEPEALLGMKAIIKAPTSRVKCRDGIVRNMVDPMYKSRPNVFVTKVLGEERAYEIEDDTLARALNGIGNDQDPSMLLRMAGNFNKYLSWINTGMNPEFTVSNLVKDWGTAMVLMTQLGISDLQGRVAKTLPQTYKAIWNYDPSQPQNEIQQWYKELREGGGLTQWSEGQTLEDQIKRIAALTADSSGQKTLLNRGMDAAKAVVDFVEKANNTVEHSIRLATYVELRRAGVGKEQAQEAVLNLTTNFSRGGEYKSFMNAMYLFYNASLQGSVNLFASIARSKTVQKYMVSLIAAGAMQDWLMSMVSGEDEDGIKFYDKIPEWKKRTNLIIMVSDVNYIALPMPWGLNAAHNLGRNLFNGARTGDVMGAAKNATLGLADAFNPLGGGTNLFNFVAPTFLDPAVELMRNRDWRDAPIIPEQMPWSTQKPNSQLYWNSTNGSFKVAAELLNTLSGGTENIPGYVDLSPTHMQYFYDFMTGAAGSFVLRGLSVPSKIAGWASGEEFDWGDVPFARKVVGTVTSQADLDRFMEINQRVLSIEADLKAAQEAGDVDRIQAIYDRYGSELAVSPFIKSAVNRRSKLATQVKQLDKVDLPPEYKSVMRKLLLDEMRRAVLGASRIYRERVE